MVTEVQGRSPWHLAWERLRHNKVALAFGVLFILLVLFSLAAPLWADHVAHTGPNQNHITDKILIDCQETYVVSPDGTPLGPGLRGRYLLGADQNGLLGEPVHERCNQGCDADVGDHLDRQRGAEHRSGGISGDLEREQSEGNGEQAGADKGDDLGEEQRPVGAVA